MTTLLLALAFATGSTGDTGTPTDTGAPAATVADTASGDSGAAAPVADTSVVTAAGLAGETGGLGCSSTRGSVRLGVLVGLVVLLRRRGGKGEGSP
mgnify:FL=1